MLNLEGLFLLRNPEQTTSDDWNWEHATRFYGRFYPQFPACWGQAAWLADPRVCWDYTGPEFSQSLHTRAGHVWVLLEFGKQQIDSIPLLSATFVYPLNCHPCNSLTCSVGPTNGVAAVLQAASLSLRSKILSVSVSPGLVKHFVICVSGVNTLQGTLVPTVHWESAIYLQLRNLPLVAVTVITAVRMSQLPSSCCSV